MVQPRTKRAVMTRKRHAFISLRGNATHAALTLLKDQNGQDFYGQSRVQLEKLLRHKVNNLLRSEDRMAPCQRQHEDLRKFLETKYIHHRWVAACCGHLAAVLDAWQVTDIYAVEARLPELADTNGNVLDTGEMDLIGFSQVTQGTIGFEIKSRFDPRDVHVKHKKAMHNALGLEAWLEARSLPELTEMIWVFFTPHPVYRQTPIMTEKSVLFSPYRVHQLMAIYQPIDSRV